MHVVNDYAACAWQGIDAYVRHGPATWTPTTFRQLGCGWVFLGINGRDSVWLSAAVIAAAAVVMALLLRGRCWYHGVISLFAIVSPTVLMGVERGNLDLLILALVGAAALIYEERRVGRACGAIAFLALGIALKLFPMFCVSLVARFSRQTFIFACVTAVMSLIYLDLAMQYVFLIRRNVPTTFILSYGYKVVFLGVDHVRSEAGLSPIGLTDTWVPASTVAVVLICAVAFAVKSFRNGRGFCSVDISAAGTAFLFGAGIYCGTYLLGTNFIYRLMFLLLCVPQLQDWQIRRRQDNKVASITEWGLFATVLGVLWLNGNANGHSIFLIVPQILNWLLFFCMAVVLMLNLLRSCDAAPGWRPRDGAARNR